MRGLYRASARHIPLLSKASLSLSHLFQLLRHTQSRLASITLYSSRLVCGRYKHTHTHTRTLSPLSHIHTRTHARAHTCKRIDRAGDMEHFLAVAVDAAKLAGKVIADSFYKTKNVEHKGQVDLVTETDKACEKLVFEHIGKCFPDHKFIGEETTALSGSFDLTDAPTWIIDPLDGTTNFVHRFPFVCVSIGLTIEKVPVVGVVYNPILNELFTAVKGGGAFLNGKPIRASSQENIGSAILASEVGTKRDKATVDATTNRINSLLYKVRSLRMTGSCALNLCGIACGRLDIFYELGYGGPWDVAAGVIIVQEADGMIFSPSGEAFDIGTQRIAASNGYLKDSLVKALKETDIS